MPLGVTVAALVGERLLDTAALATLAALGREGSSGTWPLLVTAGVSLLAAWAALTLSASLARAAGLAREAEEAVRRPRTALVITGLSLAAWIPAAFILPLAAASIDAPLPLVDGLRAFGRATLAGGVSLMPAGVATTGSVAIEALRDAGLALSDAVLAVSLFRLGTAGLTLAVGSSFLLLELRALRRPTTPSAEHFAEIADGYLDQFQPHVWDLLLERRVALLEESLPSVARGRGVGLDLGCGLAHPTRVLRERGYHVLGVDAAAPLVRRGHAAGVPVAVGDALHLPFPDASLDYVYAIGVLHHLPDPDAQARAVDEVRRVLRPGGRFLVQETNPRNPLFRLYMGYVFPIVRSIDEGTEWWIPPATWRELPGLRAVGERYFTFLPDFLPRAFLGPLLALERWLERGRLSALSAHYLAVLEKPGAPGGGGP